MIGNKLDMEHERSVATERGQSWANENGITLFYEGSAVSGASVEEAFMAMAKKALDRSAE